MAEARAHIGCSGWVYNDWRGLVYPREAAAAPLVRALRDALRHRRDQQHLLPAAPDDRRSSTGRAGAARVRLRREARPVRLASHEAPRRRSAGCRTTSTAYAASARPSARRSSSSRRAGSATWSGSTSSSPRPGARPGRCAGRWSSATPRGSTTTCTTCSRRHGAALCVHDLLPDHPWVRTTDWTLRALPRAATPSCTSTTAATDRSGWSRRPSGSGPGWPRAATCTATSTTTGRGSPCRTRPGCATGYSRVMQRGASPSVWPSGAEASTERWRMARAGVIRTTSPSTMPEPSTIRL